MKINHPTYQKLAAIVISLTNDVATLELIYIYEGEYEIGEMNKSTLRN